MNTAKKKFEKEREKTLAELPESVKAMFGQIGFAASEHDENEIIPVLVLSPYDVPPKPVRDVYWYDLFGKAKRSKSVDKLAYLVYHYGHDDPDDCYSFIEQDEFYSYEEGKERGYDVMPEALAAKLKAGGDLTEEEEIRVRGLKEMEEDVPKAPEERKRGTTDFLERHEKLKEPPAKKRKT